VPKPDSPIKNEIDAIEEFFLKVMYFKNLLEREGAHWSKSLQGTIVKVPFSCEIAT